MVDSHNRLPAGFRNRQKDGKDELSLEFVVCYRFNEKGHVKRRCP